MGSILSKNRKTKIKDFEHENFSYDEYTLEVEVLLQLILGCLALLVIIVLIIALVLCIKFCTSNNNQKIADVPPAFIYVCPWSSTQTNPLDQNQINQIDQNQMNRIMEQINPYS